MNSVRLKHLTLGGFVLAALCAAFVGTAGTGTASPVSLTNYATDQAANLDASDLAQTLTPIISADPHSAGVWISADGLEIATVGSPAPSLVNPINAAAAAAARPVQINFRQVQHSTAVLTQTKASIIADRETWASQGVHISGAGLEALRR